MENNKTIGHAISGVMLFALCIKTLGFLREWLLSYYFGASGMSDAYLISQTIPGTIFQFVGVGLTTCYVPICSRILSTKGNADSIKFTNKVLTLVFIFSTLVVALVWVDTESVIKLFASGFEGKTLQWAIVFTRIGVLSLYASSIIYVYESYLHVMNSFLWPAFAGIPNGLLILLSIVLGAKYNVWWMTIISTIAVYVQMFFILIPALKTNCNVKLDFNWSNPEIKQFIRLLLPVILGVSVNELNTLIDKTLASQIAIGGISALSYAISLANLFQNGLVQPITTVFFPKLSMQFAKGNLEQGRIIIKTCTFSLLGLLIPISLGMITFSNEVVSLIFGHGSFDKDALWMTSDAVKYYAIGIPFVGMREILSRYYYAKENTKIPMINSTIGVIINICLNLLLAKYMGIGGLALATSISALITVLLLFVADYGFLLKDFNDLIKQIGKIIISALFSVACAYLFYFRIILEKTTFMFICIVIIAMAIYLVLSALFKLDYFDFIKKFLFSKENG